MIGLYDPLKLNLGLRKLNFDWLANQNKLTIGNKKNEELHPRH